MYSIHARFGTNDRNRQLDSINSGLALQSSTGQKQNRHNIVINTILCLAPHCYDHTHSEENSGPLTIQKEAYQFKLQNVQLPNNCISEAP